jgi:hypothetical protein
MKIEVAEVWCPSYFDSTGKATSQMSHGTNVNCVAWGAFKHYSTRHGLTYFYGVDNEYQSPVLMLRPYSLAVVGVTPGAQKFLTRVIAVMGLSLQLMILYIKVSSASDRFPTH